jgi:hypothetical protein
MTRGGGMFVIPSALTRTLSFVIPSQRWAVGKLLLVIPSQRWTVGNGREGISKLRPFFIFNNAKDVVKNYSAAADNTRPIEIPDLTIVRQE